MRTTTIKIEQRLQRQRQRQRWRQWPKMLRKKRTRQMEGYLLLLI